MSAAKATESARRFFEEVLRKSARVIQVDRAEQGQGWCAVVEAVEESDFMRRYGRGDVLGLYQVNLDQDFQVTSYSRRGLKERSAVTSDVS